MNIFYMNGDTVKAAKQFISKSESENKIKAIDEYYSNQKTDDVSQLKQAIDTMKLIQSRPELIFPLVIEKN